jgi:type IV secretory pathway VirB9-like protein
VVGHPTIFTFPDNEQIYRTPQTAKPNKDGELKDAKWEGPEPKDTDRTPLGNNLPLWPVEAGESTMTIITMTSDGKQKVYPLHLTALPNSADALQGSDVTLNMVYKGVSTPAAHAAPDASGTPISTTAQPALVWRIRQQRAEAEERIRTDAFNGADGVCHFHAQGKRPNDITPLCPMDNGMWTLMRFPGLSQKPAVYVVTGDDLKDERLARQHATGDFVVVEETAKRFRLRLGDGVLDIVNDAYNPAGKPTDTKTISSTVARVIRVQAATR